MEQEKKRKEEEEKQQQEKKKNEENKKQKTEKKQQYEKNKGQEKQKDKNDGKVDKKEQKTDENIINQFRSNEYILGGSSKLPYLKSNEKSYVENYLHMLNQQEKQNQQFFNKKPIFLTPNYNTIYDILNEDYLDKTFDRGGEKDR